MRILCAAVLATTVALPLAARGATAPVQRISGARIARIAQHEIAALPHAANEAYVPTSTVPDQMVSAGRVSLHPHSPIGSAQLLDVPVQIEINGREDRTIYVGYRIARYIETAVARHDLVPGTVLDAGDLRVARVPFAGVPGNGIRALVGRQIVGAVLKGQPVTIMQTTVNQIVKPGSTVVLVVRDGGVEVSADVIARTGGGLGDQVFVYNPQTHKALSGTVTAPGTVELNISQGENQ